MMGYKVGELVKILLQDPTARAAAATVRISFKCLFQHRRFPLTLHAAPPARAEAEIGPKQEAASEPAFCR